MSNVNIPVCVQLHRELYNCDPLAAYHAAVQECGRDNAFILESLSGPPKDRKATIVGMDPLFSVSVYEGEALVKGEESLVATLYEHLMAMGFERDDNGAIRLSSKEESWRLLRVLREPFQTDRLDGASLAYFGYFSYDTIRLIEDIESIACNADGYPVISLTVFQTLVYFHAGGKTEALVNNSSLWRYRDLSDYNRILEARGDKTPAPVNYPSEFSVHDTVESELFMEWVDNALYHISVGDIYQIQLGHEVQVESSIAPFDAYRALRENNPSPYMYMAHMAGLDLIGASPELFVLLNDDVIEMRPIAGTVGKRPGVPVEDLIESMTSSEKESAEHIMLVDMCRNDIGRVCEAGTLEVDELMHVEEYSHLYHMVSNVKGGRKQGYDAFDVIKATFPAGTMTGAPKVRAVELIESMERNRRGIYAGAVGLIGFDDSINTALCIRSAVHKEGTYYLRASAGVVADSCPEKEWKETFYKMSSVFKAVTGKEILS